MPQQDLALQRVTQHTAILNQTFEIEYYQGPADHLTIYQIVLIWQQHERPLPTSKMLNSIANNFTPLEEINRYN